MERAVLFSCAFVPVEWIEAHGFTPRKVIPGQGNDHSLPGAAMGLCPYAGAFAREACASGDASAIIVTTLCDQMRRISEVIGETAGVPLFLMNVPSTWEQEGARALYRVELARLGAFLEDLGGRAPSQKALAEVMIQYEKGRAGPSPSPRQGVRLAITGGPASHFHRSFYHYVEGKGGTVVLDATDSGERSFPGPYDRSLLERSPFEAMADAYFGTITHPARRPNRELYRWLERELHRRAVEGIVLLRYLWCDLWHAEAAVMRERFSVPLLDIDIEGCGSPGDVLDARTSQRLCAFLEMLK
ncbi:MAG: 2-hydroxyacyl-CoA dehydratase family protein [Candidatus Eremiobacteraeota bacterium]|nr:2-hydroxyacyl-CoA dehydratase family protein [Candidatus Eremiobacteraeota bacterium]